mmetsp:Transcript_79970/g.235231  ORF Transcript_79970/g.235231 Transcript_79970/m.235231 type:complete len:239 (-) Transcript_79970:56-772(-)
MFFSFGLVADSKRQSSFASKRTRSATSSSALGTASRCRLPAAWPHCLAARAGLWRRRTCCGRSAQSARSTWASGTRRRCAATAASPPASRRRARRARPRSSGGRFCMSGTRNWAQIMGTCGSASTASRRPSAPRACCRRRTAGASPRRRSNAKQRVALTARCRLPRPKRRRQSCCQSKRSQRPRSPARQLLLLRQHWGCLHRFLTRHPGDLQPLVGVPWCSPFAGRAEHWPFASLWRR